VPAVDRAVERARGRQDEADFAPTDASERELEIDLFSSVFFWLLVWDSTACFLFVSTLFGSIEGAGTGYGWRARQSYYVLHSLFMLSALPFVPFVIANALGLSAGTGPSTAFNRNGLQLPSNPNGLAAYCRWVLRILGRWDVQRTLSRTDRKALHKEALRLMRYTESFPFASKAQAERRDELHEMLDSAFRRALASRGITDPYKHGVYRACFPNESACHDYVSKSAKRVEASRRARTRSFVRQVRERAGVEGS